MKVRERIIVHKQLKLYMISELVTAQYNKCKAIWKMSKCQAEERRAIRDLQVQEQAEVRSDRGADDEPMFAWKVSSVFCLNILFQIIVF